MKNIIILGAAGRTGVYILRRLNAESEPIEITAFDLRRDERLEKEYPQIKIVAGDATDKKILSDSLDGQDIVIATLEGNVLPMARCIADVCKEKRVGHIIWLTGMGIHSEIKGIRKPRLDRFIKLYPDYIKAADTIAESGVDYTLLRCPDIHDGENKKYYLTDEGEQPRNRNVERAAIAEFIADAVTGMVDAKNRSIAITN